MPYVDGLSESFQDSRGTMSWPSVYSKWVYRRPWSKYHKWASHIYALPWTFFLMSAFLLSVFKIIAREISCKWTWHSELTENMLRSDSFQYRGRNVRHKPNNYKIRIRYIVKQNLDSKMLLQNQLIYQVSVAACRHGRRHRSRVLRL